MSPTVRFHSQPSEGGPAGAFLKRLLTDADISSFDVVVAWVRYRGVARLRDELRAFKDRGQSRIILGIDEGGATRPGLVAALRNFSEAYVYHVRSAGTFHPKLYLASGEARAHLFVGSSNLTPGGLFFNDEVSLEAEFALPADAGESALVDAHAYLDALLADDEVCLRLTADLIEQLVDDPRYRVSATERRERRVDVPLPEGADVDDVEQDGGESASDETDVEPIFGSSRRVRQAVAAGLSFDRAVATLADDRRVLAAARSVFPELRRRGRESSRFLASSVRAQGPQAVSPSAARASEELADLFPEIKRRKKRRGQRKERVLEYPGPRAAVAEPSEHGRPRPLGPPAESADLWGRIEEQFPGLAAEAPARKAKSHGRITWAEGRRC